jgi:thiamine biosynthesis lipoprotein
LLVSALALVFVLERVLFPPRIALFQDSQEMMDTWVTIKVYDYDSETAEKAIDKAFSRMRQVEYAASTYDQKAEAYRLNEQGRLDNPSNDLWEIIEAAIAEYLVTDGAFDITVEPLLDLWRYKEETGVQFWELDSATQQQAIAEIMPVIGANGIKMIDTPQRSIVLKEGMKITLGGIAKGYAVDRGLEVLRQEGIEYALIDAGGDIGAFGGKPDGGKWQLALRDPQEEASCVVTFAITDGAIATSGNYERFFDPAGEVGHIMDPRTGYSSHASSSSTVIARTCAQADALATATFVLGPKLGIELVDSLEGVEALIIDYEDPHRLFMSEGMSTYIDQEKGGQ